MSNAEAIPTWESALSTIQSAAERALKTIERADNKCKSRAKKNRLFKAMWESGARDWWVSSQQSLQRIYDGYYPLYKGPLQKTVVIENWGCDIRPAMRSAHELTAIIEADESAESRTK